MAPKKAPSIIKSSKRVRMRDVANRCGVSISTVSLVLSGDPRIPEDTTRRVLQAVKALEYRPSVVARNLARRSSRTIGVIFPEFAFQKNSGYYLAALEGIHSQSQSAGYKLVVEAANPVFLERRYYLRLLKEQSVDGMIYLAAKLSDSFLNDMASEPYPFLMLGNGATGVQLPVLKVDGGLGARLAVEHLISLGHKRIGYISGEAHFSASQERLKGYEDAMKKAGLDPFLVENGGSDMEKAKEAALRLVRRGVTAIQAGNDSMAFGALRGLQEVGKRVPEDVALVGMDDLEMAGWMTPSLTTVRTHVAACAALAAKTVIGRIQAPLSPKTATGPVPEPELIVRSSCGANSI